MVCTCTICNSHIIFLVIEPEGFGRELSALTQPPNLLSSSIIFSSINAWIPYAIVDNTLEFDSEGPGFKPRWWWPMICKTLLSNPCSQWWFTYHIVSHCLSSPSRIQVGLKFSVTCRDGLRLQYSLQARK